ITKPHNFCLIYLQKEWRKIVYSSNYKQRSTDPTIEKNFNSAELAGNEAGLYHNRLRNNWLRRFYRQFVNLNLGSH
ncbi:hypothetical protein, partial [Testudinibacter sp. TR-2022]|uniref:hypothetical protein n=1 Tax=Testudinibacter sp. TR-2022 TaxID=2585029 RepID=UPI002277C8DD